PLCSSSPQHHHQKVVAHAPQQRPARRASVHLPQSLVETRMLLSHGGQVRRWRPYTHTTIVFQREVRSEGTIKLARRVITGPHRSLVHTNGLHIPGEADADTPPVAFQGVVPDFPRTCASD